MASSIYTVPVSFIKTCTILFSSLLSSKKKEEIMLIVVPSLVILALGTLIVLVIKMAFPSTVKNEHVLIKKTILYKREEPSGLSPEWRKSQNTAKDRNAEKLRPSDLIYQNNTQNI